VAGTVLVKDIVPGPDGSNPTALSNVNGWLLFAACAPSSGCEVWQSDGTAAGTRQFADIAAGGSAASLSGFTLAGSLIYVTAEEELPHGRALWAIPVSALDQPLSPTPTATTTAIPSVTPTATSGPPCTGDCDGNGRVAIHELVLGVNIVLGPQSVNACPAFASSQGTVDIAQLMKGVNNAMKGCGLGLRFRGGQS
jgi:ELWxxDGT repeat protein